MSRARAHREKKLRIWGTLLLLAAAMGAIFTIAYKMQHETAHPDAMLCPADGARGHVILLVDKTDPLSFTQRRAFTQMVDELAGGKFAHEGQLLSVFVLGEDY